MSLYMEEASYIKRNELDEINYFESLIDNAVSKKYIDMKMISYLQLKIIELLKMKIKKYNLLSSSSIMVEKADMIMKSNMYTIGLRLKQYTPDKAIKLLEKSDICELYEEGRRILINKIKVSKLLYRRLINNMLETSNEIYNATIIGGISGFFKLYDLEYNAAEINITADYPLYNNLIGKYIGIEFIEKYIESIYIENEFCRMFDMAKIESLLTTFSLNASILIINISSIVLTECLGCVLVDKNIENLSVSRDDINLIYELFSGKSKEEIYTLISDTFEKINFSTKAVKCYFKNGLDSIKYEIYNRYKIKKLDKIFITQLSDVEYS